MEGPCVSPGWLHQHQASSGGVHRLPGGGQMVGTRRPEKALGLGERGAVGGGPDAGLKERKETVVRGPSSRAGPPAPGPDDTHRERGSRGCECAGGFAGRCMGGSGVRWVGRWPLPHVPQK